jgi:cytochrome c biogenesis protein CcmG, thiol:disulfide interchange protein DsbE
LTNEDQRNTMIPTRALQVILGLTFVGLLTACERFIDFQTDRDTLSADTYQSFVATHLEPVPLTHLNQLDIQYQLAGGQSEHMQANSGKALLINFWSTWCYPCRIEMPDLESLYRLMKSEKFRILAVNYGEPQEKVARFLRQHPYAFDVVLDETTSIGQRFEIEGLPTTIVIDREGNILGKITGPKDWKASSMMAFFRTISR